MGKTTNNPASGGWFTEAELPYSKQDIRLSSRYTEVLFDKKSPFGHVQIFDTPFYGRMLTLDGIIQVAEKDEFIYHEMMVTLPAIKHGEPKSILVVGGGDGGAVKQAVTLPGVERVVLVEIDTSVIDVCQTYMPSIADGSLQDSKVEVIIADGKKYIEETKEKFDLIVLDLTDPVPDGPAEALFTDTFYQSVKNCLKPGGIMSTHCGSLLFQPEEAGELKTRLEKVFKDVVLHYAIIPTYQLSYFGFLIASDEAHQTTTEEVATRIKAISRPLKYLTPAIFENSTVLPPYLEKRLGLIGK